MHPTVKAARVAGAIYFSEVIVGPFSFAELAIAFYLLIWGANVKALPRSLEPLTP